MYVTKTKYDVSSPDERLPTAADQSIPPDALMNNVFIALNTEPKLSTRSLRLWPVDPRMSDGTEVDMTIVHVYINMVRNTSGHIKRVADLRSAKMM